MTWLVADAEAATLVAALGWRDAASALADPRGRTVRCTPRRRTVLQEVPGGAAVFKKVRFHGAGATMAEWHTLRLAAEHGFATVRPVCAAVLGRDSMLVTMAASGLAGDVALARSAEARTAAVGEFAPEVARLHALGLCYRDLYWNHVVRERERWLLLDTERLFAPRWRLRRWVVKDLAGLLASAPRPACTRSAALRFLRAYLGALDGAAWKSLARAVAAKAARIAAHRPKYG